MITAKEARQLTNESCTEALLPIEENVKKAAKQGHSSYIQSTLGQFSLPMLKMLEDLGYVVDQLPSGTYRKYEISWS